jgi:cytidylate kinase
MVVTIDGPAGTGKSTVAHTVSQKTGFFYLNSGRFYRAITWKALRQGKTAEHPQAIMAIAGDIKIELQEGAFLVDGVDRTAELHTTAVDEMVAHISAIPEVRLAVNTRLRRVAGTMDVIAEGRDMSTVVFPDAAVKIYLDADPWERARRRHAERREEGSIEEIHASIEARDEIDRNKEVGKLQKSADANYIDTTDLTLPEVCEIVIELIQEKKRQE